MLMMFCLLFVLITSQAVAVDFQPFAKLQLQPGIAIEFRASKFDESRHKITKLGQGPVRLIDGKQFFGTDGGLPKTQLDSAVMLVSERRIVLDVSGMSGTALREILTDDEDILSRLFPGLSN